MVIITAIVASTAIRIEWYNHAVGGFLPRPQPPSIEGNDIKWRVGHPDWAEAGYRRELAYDRGLGVGLTDEQLASLPVSDTEQAEINRLKRKSRLNAEFRSLVGSMGCMQHLLIPIGLACSMLLLKRKSNGIRVTAGVCLAINTAGGILMFYREYYLSLGW